MPKLGSAPTPIAERPQKDRVPAVPVFQEYMNAVLQVLRANDGQADIAAINAGVAKQLALPAEILAIPHKPDEPGQSEVGYRLRWARTYLNTTASRRAQACQCEKAGSFRSVMNLLKNGVDFAICA